MWKVILLTSMLIGEIYILPSPSKKSMASGINDITVSDTDFNLGISDILELNFYDFSVDVEDLANSNMKDKFICNVEIS
jgi:hypothetical protein